MSKFIVNEIAGPQHHIWMYPEGYVARPVMLSKSSGTITPDEEGRYIIPAGTFLTGSNEDNTLLVNPNQLANIVAIASVNASADLQAGKLRVEAKDGGLAGNNISVTIIATVLGKKRVEVVTTGTDIVATLVVDADGVKTTVKKLADALNNDLEANSLIKAIVLPDDEDDPAIAEAKTMLEDGADSTSQRADGILFNDVDVTYGEAPGAMMIAGFVNLDKLPKEPSASIEQSLRQITFLRID